VGRRSQWPRSLRRRSAAARLLRLFVRIPPGTGMSVSYECCVLSGRGLCDGLITRPEESYRLWSVFVCHLETSIMRRPWPTGGLSRPKRTNCVGLPNIRWKNIFKKTGFLASGLNLDRRHSSLTCQFGCFFFLIWSRKCIATNPALPPARSETLCSASCANNSSPWNQFWYHKPSSFMYSKWFLSVFPYYILCIFIVLHACFI